MRKILTTALAGTAIFATAAVAADTADFTVNAEVPAYCSFDQSSYSVNLTYNPLDITNSTLTSSTTANFNCVRGTNFQVTVDGTIYSAPITRTLTHTTDTAETLEYTLSISGDTSGTANTITDTFNITLQASLDPTLPANDDPKAGTYTDTVTLGFIY